MSILDWIFIGLLSGAILFLFFSVLSFYFTFSAAKKYKYIESRRPKNKKKRKKWRRQLSIQKQQRSKRVVSGFLFLVLTGLAFGSSLYTRQYQLTHLDEATGETIVQSYFLVDSIEKELESVANGASPEKAKNTLQNISALLISYSSGQPSGRISLEGQQLLKRYYANIQEFGVNIHSQSVQNIKKPEVIDSYLKDIEKIKGNQQKVFKKFKVNESALKQKQ